MGQRYRRAAVLLAAAAVQFAALLVVYEEFVTKPLGQLVDAASVTGGYIGFNRVEPVVSALLDVVSVASLLVATVAVAVVALVRRRYVLAAATSGLIIGANVTTQVLKRFVLERPDMGVGTMWGVGGPENTLPSGHTTVAASVAVALTLVVPSRIRAPVGVLAAVYAAITGVGTLTAAWHRPSDAIAAYLVVGAWAALVGVVILFSDHRLRSADAVSPPVPSVAVGLLSVVGCCCVGAGAVVLAIVAHTPVAQIGDAQLLVAYAGGAGVITGTAVGVFAAVLALSGWLAPERVAPPARPPRVPLTHRAGRVDSPSTGA